jgi:hypothetical protein
MIRKGRCFAADVSESESDSESHVTTDGQSASLSRNKAPIWDLRPDFYYCQTVAGLLMWGALSDERTGLSSTIAAGSSPAQSLSGPSPVGLMTIFYFFRLVTSFSSSPTTRRTTVEVFDPASTRDNQVCVRLTCLANQMLHIDPQTNR